MADRSLRATLVVRGFVAHMAGLFVASFWVAFQISGFSVAQTGIEGTFLGAFLASPWATAMLLAFLSFPRWIENHPVLTCLLGPVLVWTSAYLTAVSGIWIPMHYMEPVFVASIVASAVYYALYRRHARLARAETATGP